MFNFLQYFWFRWSLYYNYFLDLFLLPASLSFLTDFGIGTIPFQFHKQLFQGVKTRLPESNYQEQEKDYDHHQTGDIENLLLVLDKCGQLIIVHYHAESKVYPVLHLELSRLSSYPRQLNSEVNVLNDKDIN